MDTNRDLQTLDELSSSVKAIRAELAKAIIGQEAVIDDLLACFLSGGHCLLVGVPGLAKTTLVQTLANSLALEFSRIQFTPDLMPSDITGTDIIQEDPDTHRRVFTFVKGPIFANMLLADEINRTPPKTQAALLQAMQEYQVTAAGQTFPLEPPFFVLATQNPVEQEGTYPLPEAQLDRFMFMVLVNYPSRDEELEVLKRTTGAAGGRVAKVIGATKLLELQELVRRVPASDHVFNLALDIARATRPNESGASDFVRHWLNWGAGPRAGQYMILAGKARALLHGRLHVTAEDIEAVAPPVLRHRIIPNFNADAEGITVEHIIQKVLALVPRTDRGEKLL
jgi:MoxR-like ATPase